MVDRRTGEFHSCDTTHAQGEVHWHPAAGQTNVALTWSEVLAQEVVGKSKYDWCWVCGKPLGPDRMHVMIDNGVVTRHTYACRGHRYVIVRVGNHDEVQTRTDYEIESLAHSFRFGELKPGWE